jgi:peroxiredoxin Q/BCP
MAEMIAPGDKAPDFHGMAVGGEFGDGTPVGLQDFFGRTLILYFYPKDDTPGCTQQACLLRDRYQSLIDGGAVVLGVSADDELSHRKFIMKHNLPFALFSDPSKAILEAYGVWVEKSMYGKKYMGVERSTFVIRPNGFVKSVFRKVKPAEHTDVLLNALKHFEP